MLRLIFLSLQPLTWHGSRDPVAHQHLGSGAPWCVPATEQLLFHPELSSCLNLMPAQGWEETAGAFPGTNCHKADNDRPQRLFLSLHTYDRRAFFSVQRQSEHRSYWLKQNRDQRDLCCAASPYISEICLSTSPCWSSRTYYLTLHLILS